MHVAASVHAKSAFDTGLIRLNFIFYDPGKRARLLSVNAYCDVWVFLNSIKRRL